VGHVAYGVEVYPQGDEGDHEEHHAGEGVYQVPYGDVEVPDGDPCVYVLTDVQMVEKCLVGEVPPARGGDRQHERGYPPR